MKGESFVLTPRNFSILTMDGKMFIMVYQIWEWPRAALRTEKGLWVADKSEKSRSVNEAARQQMSHVFGPCSGL